MDEEVRRMEDAIRRFTFAQIRLQNQALEMMAEKMLVDPEGRGIAMIQFPLQTTLTLEEGIPFGHIFEFPSLESYECWINLGRPT